MNTLINILAGLGLLFVAAFLELIFTAIGEEWKGTGFIIIILIEYYYICYLENKVIDN